MASMPIPASLPPAAQKVMQDFLQERETLCQQIDTLNERLAFNYSQAMAEHRHTL